MSLLYYFKSHDWGGGPNPPKFDEDVLQELVDREKKRKKKKKQLAKRKKDDEELLLLLGILNGKV